MTVAPLAELARREAVALHAFFVQWFRDAAGTVDFSFCERSLAPDFTMVTPDGRVHDRAAVLERIRQAHGTAPADFAIIIRDPRPLWQGRDAVLLGYVEQQVRDGRQTRRRSSGLFTRRPASLHGVVWRHLQETWMANGKNV
ncbi:MAG: DUF4440 domain-containing protein [Pseudomonadota bacterium]|nr:DUF4440 domain-containing protein [Pseudomonadota bacterium]